MHPIDAAARGEFDRVHEGKHRLTASNRPNGPKLAASASNTVTLIGRHSPDSANEETSGSG